MPARRPTWLTLATFAAAAATFGVGAYVAQLLATQALDGRARGRAEVTASLAALSVEQNARRLTELVVLTAERPELAAALRSGDARAAQRIVASLVATGAGIRAGFAVEPDGTVLAMSPVDRSVLGRNYRGRDWYRGVSEASPYISKAYNIAAFDRPRAITIAANVPDPRDASRRAGIVTVVQATSAFEPLLGDIARDRGTHLSILDQAGQLVAGPSLSPRARAAAREAGESGTATARTGSGQRGAFIAAAAIPAIGWTVVSDTPARVALSELPTLRWTAVAFGAIGALLLLGLLAAYIRMSRRVQRAELAELRHAQAFEINDSVVQRLVIAQMALELGRIDEAKAAIGAALDSGSELITRLAASETLTRSTGATDDGGRDGDAP